MPETSSLMNSNKSPWENIETRNKRRKSMSNQDKNWWRTSMNSAVSKKELLQRRSLNTLSLMSTAKNQKKRRKIMNINCLATPIKDMNSKSQLRPNLQNIKKNNIMILIRKWKAVQFSRKADSFRKNKRKIFFHRSRKSHPQCLISN